MTVKKHIYILVPIVLLIIMGLRLAHLIKKDNPVDWAREAYPLGLKQRYVIQPNEERRDEGGNIVLEEGAIYMIVVSGEKQQQTFANGRQIGKTQVDLEPYTNKEVYIEGDFYEGSVLLRKPVTLPNLLAGERKTVLHVQSLQLAEID